MQEYMDSMQHYLGASCEVLKLNNNFLFAGSIHQYDAGEDELTVSIRNGNETPQGIIYHTPVKLHVQTNIIVFPVQSDAAASVNRSPPKRLFLVALAWPPPQWHPAK